MLLSVFRCESVVDGCGYELLVLIAVVTLEACNAQLAVRLDNSKLDNESKTARLTAQQKRLNQLEQERKYLETTVNRLSHENAQLASNLRVSMRRNRGQEIPQRLEQWSATLP